MQTLKRNYDRVFALCVALVCIVISSVLVMKSFAIGERFSFVEIPPRPKTVVEFGGTEDVMAHLEVDPRWDLPVGANGRLVHALVSAPVFVHDGEVVAAYDGPPIRGEVPNRWLIENGLPIERSDVLEIDSEGDHFSNGEEYALGQTDPNDANSHPDVLHKLRLLGVSSEDYVLKFASGAGDKFNIRRVKDSKGSHWGDWFKVGDVLPGERFKLVAGDGQSITIRELAGNDKFVIEKKAEKNFPVYGAKLNYLIEPSLHEGQSFVRGESFELGRSGISCTVETLTLESVTLGILRPDGKSERLVLKR